MKILAADDKHALAKHEADISSLFQDCFGDRMSIEVWRWAYLQNPCGNAWVTVCYDDSRMVAHYAMIPMVLRAGQETATACLSMTTMVASTHRQHGLFVKLATETYRRARESGVEWVMGFPNEMSAPGFERRLGWSLGEPDRIVAAKAREWLEHVAVLNMPLNTLKLDLSDEKIREWRLSRPGARYEWQNGVAFKRYGEGVDILAFDDPNQLREFGSDEQLHLLLPAVHPCAQAFGGTSYRFGGTGLAAMFDRNRIVRNMALSDVF